MVTSAAAVPIAQQNLVALLVLLLAAHAARHVRVQVPRRRSLHLKRRLPRPLARL